MIGSYVSADSTSERELFPVRRMFNFEWAFFWTSTLRQFILAFLADVVTFNLSFMTRFAEMSGAPTEPLGNRTTKSAFEFYEICSMDLTIGNTGSQRHC